MNSNELSLKRPESRTGDVQEVRMGFEVEAFELYGRQHEMTSAWNGR